MNTQAIEQNSCQQTDHSDYSGMFVDRFFVRIPVILNVRYRLLDNEHADI